jgi:hypothetical protein
MPETPVERVYKRSVLTEKINMWGTLHINRLTRRIEGWTVDTWSERSITPILDPKMHWVRKADGKIFVMHLDGSPNIKLGDEATDIEPVRAAFIKATLALWEQEWLEEETKR